MPLVGQGHDLVLSKVGLQLAAITRQKSLGLRLVFRARSNQYVNKSGVVATENLQCVNRTNSEGICGNITIWETNLHEPAPKRIE